MRPTCRPTVRGGAAGWKHGFAADCGRCPTAAATRRCTHPARSTAARASPAVRCDAPRLSVVVVNYHQWPDTDGLIRQLRTSACLETGAAEVVVVDNHAGRHPIAARLRRAPGVSLRRWKRNHGFARAV